MSLEQVFQRLAIQPKSVCQQCRRSFAVAARQQAPQSATAEFVQNLSKSTLQRSSTPHPSRQPDPVTAFSPLSPGSPAATRNTSAGFGLAKDMVREAAAPSARASKDEHLADLQRGVTRNELEKQLPRRWRVGDVYAPHDLSGAEMFKWKKIRRKPKPTSKRRDVLDQLGLNPMEHYKNFSLIGEYVTEMGRIKHSSETGLRPVNQRRMAKAIRRAIGVGLAPSVYRHPELLKLELQARSGGGRGY